MHDFDRIQAEYESLIPELESDHHELFGEGGELSGEWEGGGGRRHGDSPFSENEELELAAELLDVRNEQELDHFLGGLISKVGNAIGSVVKSPIGQALGGVLKKVAKTALPIAGSALGTFIGGPAGGLIGGKLASTAGNLFGLELEGLSGEDREFEVARRFVRFASSAARHATRVPRGANPHQAARWATIAAARRHAPGLLRKAGGRPAGAPRRGPGAGARPGYYAGAPVGDMGGDGDGDDYGQDMPYGGAGTADDQDLDGDDYGDGAGEPGGFVPGGARRRGTWIRRGRRIILFGV
jgi:hypothetical protein